MSPLARRFMATAALALLPVLSAEEFLLAEPPPPPPQKTLLQHLREAPAPVFQANHSLPPLTRWGWSMPYEVRVALAEQWGYALEFGGYLTNAAVDALEADPAGANARIVALTAADPKRYPLFVLTHRPLGGKELDELPPELLARYHVADAQGQPIADPKTGKPSWRTISPLAPDEIFAWAAERSAAPLRRLRAKVPIAVVLNGGEYGLGVAGHSRPYWEQDPAVMAAKGEQSWLDFVSAQKARQERPIAEALRAACPDRRVYLWYHFGGIPSWDAPEWSNGPALLAVTDYPDQSLYYRHFNTGWEGTRDLLTNHTYATAQAIALGHPLSYNWVCAGWKKETISPPDRYLGFLKCLYALGQLGAVAGYFSAPEGMDGKPAGATPPSHLQQMMALGHAHALFSHFEPFLREGDLLSGPRPHSRDAKLPAYEFGDPAAGIRVFVRQRRQQSAWLIVAWAATGDGRETSVNIPSLGEITVLARPAGSVYLATSRQETDYEPPVVTLELQDADAQDPTARWRPAP